MEHINMVTTSIRTFGPMECADVAQILSTLAAQMQVSGFSELDLQMLDETADAICGAAPKLSYDKACYRKGYLNAIFSEPRLTNQTFMYQAGFDDGLVVLEEEAGERA